MIDFHKTKTSGNPKGKMTITEQSSISEQSEFLNSQRHEPFYTKGLLCYLRLHYGLKKKKKAEKKQPHNAEYQHVGGGDREQDIQRE